MITFIKQDGTTDMFVPMLWMFFYWKGNVYEKNTFICDYKGVSKNYNRILKESLKNLEMEERLNRLQSKLDNFTIDDLEKVIEGVEDATVK